MTSSLPQLSRRSWWFRGQSVQETRPKFAEKWHARLKFAAFPPKPTPLLPARFAGRQFRPRRTAENEPVPSEDPAPSRSQPTLSQWLDRQFESARRRLLQAISATHLTKRRPQFGQVIVPVKGSVIAAPTVSETASPDYFFHWLRNSALAIDALAALVEHQADVPQAAEQMNDFIGFSLALNKLDGSALVRQGGWGRTDDPDLAVYVRSARALESLPSDAPFSEVRFNPDGKLDILEWSRPQYDGPALRARALLHWLAVGSPDADARSAAEDLLQADLDFTLLHYADPCFDIWEEQLGLHYYNRLVTLAVLEQGVDWWAKKESPRRPMPVAPRPAISSPCSTITGRTSSAIR